MKITEPLKEETLNKNEISFYQFLNEQIQKDKKEKTEKKENKLANESQDI